MINPTKLISNITNSAAVKNHITKSITDPRYLTGALVVTSVARDTLAYGLRAIKDAKNNDLSKNQKQYMLSTDITTGITTTLIQLGAAAIISSKKVQKPICNKLFSSLKNNEKAFKTASSNFMVLSTLVGATLLAKRLIVPNIATPIAGHFASKNKSSS